MITIRGSKMPLVMKCASALQEWDNPVNDTDTEPQNIGNAVHELLQEHVAGEPLADDRIAQASRKFQCETDDVVPLYYYGTKAWKAMAPYLAGIEEVGVEEQFECEFANVRLTGKPDVDHELLIWDWKSGRIWSDASWQLQTYCYAKKRKHAGVAWLRFNDYQVIEAMKPEEFEERVLAQLELIGKQYNPGSHCTFCPGQDECAARQKRLARAFDLLNSTHGSIAGRKDLVAAYQMASQLSGSLECFYEAVNSSIRKDGPLDLGNGSEAFMAEFNKRIVNPQTAWPVLKDLLDDSDIARCVKLSNTKLDDAIKAVTREKYFGKPPRGSLGKSVTTLWDALKEADAVDLKPSTQRQVRKIQKEVKDA